MADPSALIKLGTNEKPAIEGLKSLVRGFSDAATGINQTLEIMKKGWGVVTGAVGLFAEVVGEAIEASNVQVAAEEKLRTALKLNGEFTDQAFASMKAYASALQVASLHGDETTVALQAQLVTLGVHADRVNDATKAVLGFTEAGLSGERAVRAVAQVLRGEAAPMLARFGIEHRNANKMLEQGAALFALAEARADTFSGRVQQLRNAWGDLLEEFGNALTRASSVQQILQALTRTVGSLTTDVGEQGLAGAVDELGVRFAHTSSRVIDVVAMIAEALGNFVSGIDVLTDSFDILDNKLVRIASAPLTLFFEAASDSARFLSDLGRAADDEASPGVVALSLRMRELAQDLRNVQALGPMFGPDLPPLKRGGADGKKAKRRKGEDPRGFLIPESEQQLGAFGVEALEFSEDRSLLAGVAPAIEGSAAKISSSLSAGAKTASTGVTAFFQDIVRAAKPEAELLASTLGSGIAGGLTQMAASIGQGKNVLSEIKAFFGGIIVQLGTMLVQLGTAGVLAGTLGTFIPVLAGLTGGPLGVQAGLAAIAAGLTMVGLGSALGGRGGAGGGGGGSRGAAGAGGARAGGRAETPRQQLPGARDLFRPVDAGAQEITIVNNYHQPVGDPRRVAREQRDLWEQGRSLRPWAPAGAT